jgi:hypothetical protein
MTGKWEMRHGGNLFLNPVLKNDFKKRFSLVDLFPESRLFLYEFHIISPFFFNSFDTIIQCWYFKLEAWTSSESSHVGYLQLYLYHIVDAYPDISPESEIQSLKP